MDPSVPSQQPQRYPYPLHISSQAPPRPAATRPQPEPNPRPPPTDPFLSFRELEAKLSVSLNESNTAISTRLDRIEIALGGLSKLTGDALKAAKDAMQATSTARQETTEALQKLQAFLLHTTKHSQQRSERLENLIGSTSVTGGEEAGAATVMGRVEQLERAVVELTETLGDPDAAKAVAVRHEVGANTSPSLRPVADVGVDAVDLAPPIIRVETGIQAEKPKLTDAGVEARLDEGQPESPASYMLSTGSQTVFAASPEPPQCEFIILCADISHDRAASALEPPTFSSKLLAPAKWTPSNLSGEQSRFCPVRSAE